MLEEEIKFPKTSYEGWARIGLGTEKGDLVSDEVQENLIGLRTRCLVATIMGLQDRKPQRRPIVMIVVWVKMIASCHK